MTNCADPQAETVERTVGIPQPRTVGNIGDVPTLRKPQWQGTPASESCPSLSVRRATSADMVEVFEVGASVFAESMSLAP